MKDILRSVNGGNDVFCYSHILIDQNNVSKKISGAGSDQKSDISDRRIKI